MKDSITHIQEKSISIANEIDLIDKIDSFYSNAWDKLIIVGSVAFAIVGIVLPLVIQWYQRRTLKISEELMKKEITNNAGELKLEVIKEVNSSIEQKFKDYEKQLASANASANAKIFLAQGKFNLEKGYYPVALNELITAAYGCIECSDLQTLQKILSIISDDCVPNLSIEEINDLRTAEVSDLQSFLKDVAQYDESNIYQEVIGEIKVKITKIPKRIIDKPSEQSKN